MPALEPLTLQQSAAFSYTMIKSPAVAPGTTQVHGVQVSVGPGSLAVALQLT